MQYSVTLWTERAKEIVNLSHRTVEDAIRIGQLLAEQKEEMPHGDFLKWIANELPFKADTAERFMSMWLYRDKIRSLRNLQEAYTAVKQLKSENRPQKETAQELIGAATHASAEPAFSIETPPQETREAKEQEQAIDDEYEKQSRQRAQRQIISRIDDYLRDFENLDERGDAIEALQAHLLDQKMRLPKARTDADIDKVLNNFEY